ncbi:hypothetical protein PISMIDRAFT_156604 [Pisolithus microcarpus 441]|uniref:Uncharacterized protein n=1 Tax=Pisolithus microcarpus 441 TaxID=765257 RepID=A0A0C9Z9W7_9AGAM|nr:hypothetical protein BKA83DRAFT_156604 [Pisolithus microcarpus]KIK19272.1 hypothetical protein PISMIDRAFT_156604 [Pisolithus microcarpus 441]
MCWGRGPDGGRTRRVWKGSSPRRSQFSASPREQSISLEWMIICAHRNDSFSISRSASIFSPLTSAASSQYIRAMDPPNTGHVRWCLLCPLQAVLGASYYVPLSFLFAIFWSQ